MKISLSPTPPYDFTLSVGIFSDGDEHIRIFEGRKFKQVIRVDNELVLILVESAGSVDRPLLAIELISNQEITAQLGLEAERIVSSLLNLTLDLKPFYRTVRDDKVISEIVKRFRGLKYPLTATPFEALVDSIIEQQISLAVAHRTQAKVIKSFGDLLTLKGESYYAFPTPNDLGSASVEELRKYGLSLKKAEYIRDISCLISQGTLDLGKYKDYADTQAAIEELDKIRGIGVWTAEMTLIRGIGRLDAFPADDLGLRRIISHYYFSDRKIFSEEARNVAMKWGQWKGLASFYLVMAAMKDFQS
jgi:DNA-3-methyladenine glycosylase II